MKKRLEPHIPNVTPPAPPPIEIAVAIKGGTPELSHETTTFINRREFLLAEFARSVIPYCSNINGTLHIYLQSNRVNITVLGPLCDKPDTPRVGPCQEKYRVTESMVINNDNWCEECLRLGYHLGVA